MTRDKPPLNGTRLKRGSVLPIPPPSPILLLVLFGSLGLYTSPANAQTASAGIESRASSNDAEPPGLYELLVAGPSPGEPSLGKKASVTTFYSLAVAGLAGASIFTYWYIDSLSDEDQIDARGACIDITTEGCALLLETRHERRTHATWASLSGGASLTFFLAGLVTAHYWDNTSATAAITSDEAFVQWRVRF